MDDKTVLGRDFLPYWLYFTGALSLNSVVICYYSATPFLIRRLYSHAAPADVTPLASRLFAVWNMLSTIVRFSAARNIHDRSAYSLAVWSFVVPLAHFGVELMIFKTVDTKQILVAEATPVLSLIWMFRQWSYYVK